MIVFCVILTLVCSLRACHMWLIRNYMFIRKIWGKFTSLIFWNFEISLVSLGGSQNFKKVNSVNLSQIFLLNMWLLAQIILCFTHAISEYSKTYPSNFSQITLPNMQLLAQIFLFAILISIIFAKSFVFKRVIIK